MPQKLFQWLVTGMHVQGGRREWTWVWLWDKNYLLKIRSGLIRLKEQPEQWNGIPSTGGEGVGGGYALCGIPPTGGEGVGGGYALCGIPPTECEGVGGGYALCGIPPTGGEGVSGRLCPMWHPTHRG